MNRKLIGSTVALIIGVLAFLGSVAQLANGNTLSDPLTGLLIILGALAYKSLKKRKLGIVKSSVFRQGFEGAALGIIVLLVVLQNNLQTRIINDPVTNIVVPLWSFVAYLIVFNKQSEVEIQKN